MPSFASFFFLAILTQAGNIHAAELSDAEKQTLELCVLGLMYEKGHGVPKDEVEAEKWYQKGAEQGEGMCQAGLRAMYEKRGMSKKDIEAAQIRWEQKAAEQGHADSQFYLGVRYFEGEGVKKDVFKAAAWYKKAAEQGHINAQYSLGLLYGTGEGVIRDRKKACDLIRAAAEQGNKRAIEFYNKHCAK